MQFTTFAVASVLAAAVAAASNVTYVTEVLTGKRALDPIFVGLSKPTACLDRQRL